MINYIKNSKKIQPLLVILIALIPIISCGQLKPTAKSNIEPGPKLLLTDDLTSISFTVGKVNGPVCFFIHGGPGQGSATFQHLMDKELADCLTMVYIDQRGSGRSGKAQTEGYGLERVIKDINEVRKVLEIEKVYLLAHSFGGVLAVNYAQKYPEHVQGLILASSTLHFANKETALERIKYTKELLQQPQEDFSQLDNLQLAMKDREVRKELGKKSLSYKLLTNNPETLDIITKADTSSAREGEYGLHMMASLYDTAAANIYKDYHKDYTLITKNIKAPTLVIAGNADYSVGVNHYKKFHFPNQETVVLDGGQFLFIDQKQKFTEAICNFIKEKK